LTVLSRLVCRQQRILGRIDALLSKKGRKLPAKSDDYADAAENADLPDRSAERDNSMLNAPGRTLCERSRAATMTLNRNMNSIGMPLTNNPGRSPELSRCTNDPQN
jgi:hypothetical protein